MGTDGIRYRGHFYRGEHGDILIEAQHSVALGLTTGIQLTYDGVRLSNIAHSPDHLKLSRII